MSTPHGVSTAVPVDMRHHTVVDNDQLRRNANDRAASAVASIGDRLFGEEPDPTAEPTHYFSGFLCPVSPILPSIFSYLLPHFTVPVERTKGLEGGDYRVAHTHTLTTRDMPGTSQNISTSQSS